MSRAVPLSRIQELGIRGRDDPAAQPVVWNVISMDDGGLRALHEALHPTLLLLALAGYRIDQLVLGPPDENGDVLLVDLSPRSATPIAWADYIESDTAEWPFWGRFGILVWLRFHPGLTGGVVGLDDTGGLAGRFVEVGGFPFLGYDVTVPGYLSYVLYWLKQEQEAVRVDLAARIAAVWALTDWDLTTNGLLAALQPDLWTFPDLEDEEDLRRQAFRRLGEPIAGSALAGQDALEAFLIEEASVRDGETPPSVHDRLLDLAPDDAADLERNWNSEAEALWNQHNEGRDPFRSADHRRLSYCELVFDMLNESLISLAGYDPAAGESAYGGYNLQRDDRDPADGETQWRYGGTDIAGRPPLPKHIDDLRKDLEKIGFGPLADGDMADDPTTRDVNEADDAAARRRTFGAYLEAAVREFQIYAAMDNVARVLPADEQPAVANPSLATTLTGQVNDQRYTGPVSGVVNAQTRALLKMWVERDWFCPVVVEARTLSRTNLRRLRDPHYSGDKPALVTGTAIDPAHHNLWRRTELSDAAYAFIAWDFTKHYPAPVTRPWGDPVVVAGWGNIGSWGGAFAKVARHTWPEAELTPENLLGDTPPLDERPQQGPFWSTFRVIRAIAEEECQGVIDGMNAWDSAILSGGPVHFTLGLAKRSDGTGLHPRPENCVIYPGELCAPLSLFAAEHEQEYDRFFGVFGIRPREEWADPPAEHFSSAHRKYRGWILLQADTGTFVDPRRVTPETVRAGDGLDANNHDFRLVEVLHHWHWIYRWQMAPRLSEAFREVTYRFARARIRALLDTPWGMVNGAPAGLKVGDIFTSEKAVAILERLHVWSPPTLLGVSDKEAEYDGYGVSFTGLGKVGGAWTAARDAGGSEDPTTWGDDQEKAIVAWLIGANLKADIADLVLWPVSDEWDDNLFDTDLLPIAVEEAPDIGAIAALAVAPGAEVRVRFTVTDRETEPGGCTVDATSSRASRLVASVVPAGGIDYDLVLEAPAGAAGEVTVTVSARDRRHKTTREVRVNVTPDGALPAGQAAQYVRPAPVGLSELRNSFELDDSGLFAQPED
jgi:hypothetical protein